MRQLAWCWICLSVALLLSCSRPDASRSDEAFAKRVIAYARSCQTMYRHKPGDELKAALKNDSSIILRFKTPEVIAPLDETRPRLRKVKLLVIEGSTLFTDQNVLSSCDAELLRKLTPGLRLDH